MSCSDFRPTGSWENLRLRADLLKRTRAFFEERSFLEVETPVLSHDTVIDRHLDPIPVTLFDDPRELNVGERLWLQTSPEFGMKRLLASGAPSIYQITRAFRGGGEKGPLHNPEFTMLEWYGLGHDYEAGIQFLSDLAECLLQRGPAERLTYREAFERYANVDPLLASNRQLATALRNSGNAAAESDERDRDLLLDLLLTTAIEPRLGVDHPTILCDYPASQSALARVRNDVMPVAERFELYVGGIELANGYHELLDPQVLRNRNTANNLLRNVDGKYTLPEENRLLDAMTHGLPPCAGCALGFDRLVMVAAGAKSIQEVMTFPHERA